MDTQGHKNLTAPAVILQFVLLPLLLLPLGLIPDFTLRFILLVILMGCSLSTCFLSKFSQPGASKYIGVVFILPIIASASLVVVFPEKFMEGAEVMSFKKNLPPYSAHLMGTDYKGRDILSSIINGGGNTYFISLIATIVSSVLGVFWGLSLALENKVFKTTAKLIVEIFEIFPRIFFLIIIIGVLHVWLNVVDYSPSILVKVTAVGILVGFTSMPFIARLVQRMVEKNYQMDYVLALKASAVPKYKILLYNLLYKNVIPHVIVQISFVLGLVILIDSTLEYVLSIGFGGYGKAGYLSWGRILADARHSAIFGEKLWIIVPPISGIVLSILGFNIIGDYLSTAFSRKVEK